MTEGIIIAVITGAFTILGGMANGGKRYAVLETKLDELTREVRKHNGFAERVPVVEEQVANIKQEINELKSYHK